MLYISNVLGRNKYEVTDTDDGVSEVVTRNDIIEYTENLGIAIQGVNKEWGSSHKYEIYSIRVQVPHAGVRFTKLQVLKGIDLKVVDGVLLGISFVKNVELNSTIRLSDYCTSIGSYVFQDRNFMETSFNGKVVLLIDDKIQKVDGKAFKDCYMFNNLWFDLSECSDKLASVIYAGLRFEGMFSSCQTSHPTHYVRVIDSEYRLNREIAEYLLTTKRPNIQEASALKERLLPYKDYLFEKYKKTFKQVSIAKIIFTQGRYGKSRRAVDKAVEALGRDWGKPEYISKRGLARISEIDSITKCLMYNTTISRNAVLVLKNYLYIFGVENQDTDFVYNCYVSVARNLIAAIKEEY